MIRKSFMNSHENAVFFQVIASRRLAVTENPFAHSLPPVFRPLPIVALASSVPGGAKPQFPTSSARRPHNPERIVAVYSLNGKKHSPLLAGCVFSALGHQYSYNSAFLTSKRGVGAKWVKIM